MAAHGFGVGAAPAPIAVAPAPAAANNARAVVARLTEKEPCTWPLMRTDVTTAGNREWAPITEVRLRSVASTVEAIIEFVNESDEAVRALWLDFSGNEVYYTVIEPKAKRKYRTYVNHPWIIRAVATGRRMMLGASMVVLGSATESQARIKAPPSLPWTLETHGFYPTLFKEATRTLLLCHKRLQRSASATNPTVIISNGLLNTSSTFPSGSLACEGFSCNVASPHPAAALPSFFKDPPDMLHQMKSPEDSDMSHSSSYRELARPALVCIEAFCNVAGSSACLPMAPRSTTPFTIPPTPVSDEGCAGLDTADVDMPDVETPDPLAGGATVTRGRGSEAGSEASVPLRSNLGRAASAVPANGDLGLTGRNTAGKGQCEDSVGRGWGLVNGRVGSLPVLAMGVPELAERAMSVAGGAGAAPAWISPCLTAAHTGVLGWLVQAVTQATSNATHVPSTVVMSRGDGSGARSTFQHTTPQVCNLEGIAALPAHLLVHLVVVNTVPSGVHQCVSRGPPSAHPDILPAALTTDPSSWPKIADPQALAQAQ